MQWSRQMAFTYSYKGMPKKSWTFPDREKPDLPVEPDCPLERGGCIEANPLAVSLPEICLRVNQQSGGNSGALRSREYRHSANVAFVLVDDTIISPELFVATKTVIS
jgi:hypothetical protein